MMSFNQEQSTGTAPQNPNPSPEPPLGPADELRRRYGYDGERQIMVINPQVDFPPVPEPMDVDDDDDFAIEQDIPHPHFEDMLTDSDSGIDEVDPPYHPPQRLLDLPDLPTRWDFIWTPNATFAPGQYRLLSPIPAENYWIQQIRNNGFRSENLLSLDVRNSNFARRTLGVYGQVESILARSYYPNYCFTTAYPPTQQQVLVAVAHNSNYVDMTTEELAEAYDDLDRDITYCFLAQSTVISYRVISPSVTRISILFPQDLVDRNSLQYRISSARQRDLTTRSAGRPVPFPTIPLLSFMFFLISVTIWYFNKTEEVLFSLAIGYFVYLYYKFILALGKRKNLRRRSKRPKKAVPQDPSDPTTSEEAGASTAPMRSEGVDLIENRGTLIGEPMKAEPTLPPLVGFDSKPETFEVLTDRWNNCGDFLWSTSDAEGTILSTMNLPIDLLESLSSNPTSLPFLQYVYFKPQLTIRFQLNSTRFHSGALVIGTQYYPALDNGTDGVRNPQSDAQVFQLDFATLRASSSNIVEISIPFQSPFDMIPLRSGAVGSSQYYATVYIAVAAGLGIGDGGSDTVTVTRQVKFSCDGQQTEFFGLRSRLAVSQGLSDIIGGVANAVGGVASSLSFIPGASEVASIASIGGSLASSVIKPVEGLFSGLGSVFKSLNMDRPSIPTDPEHRIIFPVTSLSWGEGAMPAKSLRLQPNTLTPHHPQTVPRNGDLLSTKSISRKWGLVAKATISTTNEVGDLLFTLPVAPLQWYEVGPYFLPTPLAGVAGMFTYWRGAVEYKFVLMKADPQSVRLRFSEIPSNSTTGEDLINYKSVVQDFEEVCEYVHEVPFMGPTKFLPILVGTDAVNAGYLQVRLESRMINMSSCSDNFTILVFQRSGKNLELSVPRAVVWRPALTHNPDSGDPVISINVASLRTGILPVLVVDPLHIVTNQLRFQGETITISSNQTWVASVSSLSFTAQGVSTQNGIWVDTTTLTLSGAPDTPSGSATWAVGTNDNRLFYLYTFSSLVGRTLSFESPSSNLAIPQDEVEERESAESVEGHADPKFGLSDLHFGERFDLHSLVRRPQPLYAQSTDFPTEGYYELALDLNYGEPFARGSGQQVSNLSWCHDGFRFGKGGLIYYFCIDNDNGTDTKIYAYHVPAGVDSGTNPTPAWTPVALGGLNISEDPGSHYAHDLVSTRDTIIPTIIPFYTVSKFLVNGYDSSASGILSSSVYGFGQLRYRFFAQAGQKLSFHIERAVADDLDLFVFQGWPLVTNSFDYTNANAETTLTVSSVSQKPYKKALATPQDFCEASESSSDEGQGNPTVSSGTPCASEGSEGIRSDLEYYLDLILDCKKTRSDRVKLMKYIKNLKITIPQDLPPRSVRDANSLLLNLKTYCKAGVPLPVDLVVPAPILEVEGVRPLLVKLQNSPTQHDYDRLVLFILSLYPDVDKDLLTWVNVPQGSFLRKAGSLVQFITGSIPDVVRQGFQNLDDEMNHVPSSIIGILKKVMVHLGKSITSIKMAYRIYSNYKMITTATDYWVKSMALTNLLTDFGLLNTRGFVAMAVVTELFAYFRQKPTIVQIYGGVSAWTPQDLTDEVEKTPEIVAKWAALLMGGVAALAGFSSAKSWSSGIDLFARNLANVTNSWHRMLTTSCTFILDYVLYLLGVEQPEMMALAEMRDAKIDGERWLKRVLFLVNPERHDTVMCNPALRREVAELYDEGCVFVRVLAAQKKTPVNTSIFLSIWKQLVSLYNETGEVPDSVRANMTPICVWLYGAPGVGKSEAAKTIAVKLAQLMNIAHEGDPFFVRRPRKFWDGYNGQPIIIFDDAGQVTSSTYMDQFYEDWFGIMTSAPFSPEFSAVSEKKKFVTPQIVVACSNLLYPKFPGIANPRAFQRRRDILIDVQLSADLTAQGIQDCNDLRIDPKLFETFGHIRFGQYPQTTNIGLDGSVKEIKPEGHYTLDELLKKIYPRCDHLRRIRLQSAQSNAELRDALSPQCIERNRKSLLDAIGSADLVSGVAGIIQEVAEATPQDGEDHEPSAFFTHEIKEKGLCFSSCAKLSRKCFCTVGRILNEGYSVDYCLHHGAFIMERSSNGVKSSFVLGDCSSCPRASRDAGFNQVLGAVRNNDSLTGISYAAHYPPARGAVPRIDELDVDISDFFTDLVEKADKCWFGIPRKWWLPIGLASAAVLLFGGLSLFNSARDLFANTEVAQKPKASFGEVASAVVGQMASSGSVNTKRTQKARTTYRTVVDQGTVDDLAPRLKRNRVQAKVYYENGNTASTYGLGVFDRFMVFPYHTWHRYESEISKVEVSLTSMAGQAGTVLLNPSDLEYAQINGTDLVLVNLLNRRIPRFRNILRSLVPKEGLDRIGNRGVIVNVLERDESLRMDHVPIRTSEQVAAYDLDNRIFEFNMVGFSYPLEAQGMCGSILVDSKSGLVIGMHTTAMSGMGYSTLLTSEYFKNLVPELDTDDPELPSGGMVEPRGDYLPLGCLPQDKTARIPVRTDIIKSDCYEVLAPSTRYPVNMTTPGEVVPGLSKLTLAVEKNCAPTLTWSVEDIDTVHNHMRNKILALPPASSAVKVRSFEEAIVGVLGMPYAEALQRNTSVGWPLSTGKIGTKKRNFIDYAETPQGLKVNGVHKELAMLYDVNLKKRKSGVIPFSPYQNFLKDERLKPGKLPRLINGCPLDQVIDFRRHCMDFFSALTVGGRDMGIMIGINVHGPEWSQFTNRLLSMGDKWLCGDYSGFGPGLDPELVLRCGRLCAEWYMENTEVTNEWLLIISTLFENLAFSYQVSMDTVTQMLCGSPSGNPYTAQINSLVNLYYIYLAWIDIFRGTTLEDLSMADKLIEIGVYGDDVVISVHPSIIEHFNNVTLMEVFAKKGIKYGDALKDGRTRKWCSVEEATFLKCSFLPHPTRGKGFWLAALDKAMIEDVPSWIHRDSDTKYASMENSIEACRLAYAWGHEYFQQVSAKLIGFWRQRGETLQVPTWKYLDALFFGELQGVEIPPYLDPSTYAWA